jgi:hypothetical protein
MGRIIRLRCKLNVRAQCEAGCRHGNPVACWLDVPCVAVIAAGSAGARYRAAGRQGPTDVIPPLPGLFSSN